MCYVTDKPHDVFADNLRHLLDKYHDGRQSSMAHALEVNRSCVTKWLDDGWPKVPVLLRLCRIYGVDETILSKPLEL